MAVQELPTQLSMNSSVQMNETCNDANGVVLRLVWPSDILKYEIMNVFTI